MSDVKAHLWHLLMGLDPVRIVWKDRYAHEVMTVHEGHEREAREVVHWHNFTILQCRAAQKKVSLPVE